MVFNSNLIIIFYKKWTLLVIMLCSQSQKSSWTAIFSRLHRWNFFVISSKFWRADQQLSCDFRKYYRETLTVINKNHLLLWNLAYSYQFQQAVEVVLVVFQAAASRQSLFRLRKKSIFVWFPIEIIENIEKFLIQTLQKCKNDHFRWWRTHNRSLKSFILSKNWKISSKNICSKLNNLVKIYFLIYCGSEDKRSLEARKNFFITLGRFTRNWNSLIIQTLHRSTQLYEIIFI